MNAAKRKRGRPRVLGPSVRIAGYVTVDVYAELQALAVSKKKTVSAIVRLALVEWLLVNALRGG